MQNSPPNLLAELCGIALAFHPALLVRMEGFIFVQKRSLLPMIAAGSLS